MYLKLKDILNGIEFLLVSIHPLVSPPCTLSYRNEFPSESCGAYLDENSSKVSSSCPPLLRTAQELKADFWVRDLGAASEGALKTGRAQGRRRVEVLRAARRKTVVDAMVWRGVWSLRGSGEGDGSSCAAGRSRGVRSIAVLLASFRATLLESVNLNDDWLKLTASSKGGRQAKGLGLKGQPGARVASVEE